MLTPLACHPERSEGFMVTTHRMIQQEKYCKILYVKSKNPSYLGITKQEKA